MYSLHMRLLYIYMDVTVTTKKSIFYHRNHIPINRRMFSSVYSVRSMASLEASEYVRQTVDLRHAIITRKVIIFVITYLQETHVLE